MLSSISKLKVEEASLYKIQLNNSEMHKRDYRKDIPVNEMNLWKSLRMARSRMYVWPAEVFPPLEIEVGASIDEVLLTSEYHQPSPRNLIHNTETNPTRAKMYLPQEQFGHGH